MYFESAKQRAVSGESEDKVRELKNRVSEMEQANASDTEKIAQLEQQLAVKKDELN